MWKRLSHPNIVPFVGVSKSVHHLCMVSEWMSQGNVRRYVRSNPGSNPFKLVNKLFLYQFQYAKYTISPQIVDVTKGLQYLHLNRVVHGDLKGVREHSFHDQFRVMTVRVRITSLLITQVLLASATLD